MLFMEDRIGTRCSVPDHPLVIQRTPIASARRLARTLSPVLRRCCGAGAYQEAALASDPSSGTHQPPAFRAPLGAIEDSFYQASGRRLFDASSITAHVLLVRSDRDFWSRPEDVQAFAHDATHAASVRILSLPDATHFVHLDRAEHGRDRLLNEVATFLADRGLPNQEN